MPKREARDGGHTAFTDHRIARRPEAELPSAPQDELAPWRATEPALQTRNLALAYVDAGVSNRSPAQLVRGYRMLTEVEKKSPNDVAVLRAIGRALLLGKQPAEAARAFERALVLTPGNATSEEDAGVAFLEAGQVETAIAHLEQAMASDPLLLTAATALEQAYRRQGHPERADALANRIRREMGSVPPLRNAPVH
jgi:predicted Zn-dependent protease